MATLKAKSNYPTFPCEPALSDSKGKLSFNKHKPKKNNKGGHLPDRESYKII